MPDLTDAIFTIFDSLDRPCSLAEGSPRDLWAQLDQLNAEAEAEGSRLTYAIGATLPDGTVTFDFG